MEGSRKEGKGSEARLKGDAERESGWGERKERSQPGRRRGRGRRRRNPHATRIRRFEIFRQEMDRRSNRDLGSSSGDARLRAVGSRDVTRDRRGASPRRNVVDPFPHPSCPAELSILRYRPLRSLSVLSRASIEHRSPGTVSSSPGIPYVKPGKSRRRRGSVAWTYTSPPTRDVLLRQSGSEDRTAPGACLAHCVGRGLVLTNRTYTCHHQPATKGRFLNGRDASHHATSRHVTSSKTSTHVWQRTMLQDAVSETPRDGPRRTRDVYDDRTGKIVDATEQGSVCMKDSIRSRSHHAWDAMHAYLVSYVVHGAATPWLIHTGSSERCPTSRMMRRGGRRQLSHGDEDAFASNARSDHAMQSYVLSILFVLPCRTRRHINDVHVVPPRFEVRLLGFLPFPPDQLLPKLPFEPRFERNEPDRTSVGPSPLTVKFQFTFQKDGSLRGAPKVSPMLSDGSWRMWWNRRCTFDDDLQARNATCLVRPSGCT